MKVKAKVPGTLLDLICKKVTLKEPHGKNIGFDKTLYGEHVFVEEELRFKKGLLARDFTRKDDVGKIVAIHHWKLPGQNPLTNVVVKWKDGTVSITGARNVRCSK